MTLADLPEIQITRHARSTRLRLRVDRQHIKVTAPIFCTKGQIQKFIVESEAWILKTWQAQQEKIQDIDRTFPKTLSLFNVAQPLQIRSVTQKQNFIYDVQAGHLLISNRHPELYLKTFVIDYAKQHLPEYLQRLSQSIGLAYVKCSIRQPKTRWGSCSAKHDIMLNSALVLFPEAITRYVCVHELAHTKHFDHSARFWAEVAKYDAAFKQHQKTLKTTVLPYWWLS